MTTNAVTSTVDPHAPLVLWPRNAQPKSGFACLPIFCEKAGCTCRVVRLLAVEIDEDFEDLWFGRAGLVVGRKDGSRRRFDSGASHVRAAVDLDDGTVERDGLAKTRTNAADLAAFRALVDASVLQDLRGRLAAFEAEQARDEELSRSEGWAEGDWTSWDGSDIDWRQVRPDVQADVYVDAETRYEARELYCSDLECDCLDVTILFASLKDEQVDDTPGEAIVHGPSGQLVGTRSMPGTHDLLMRLWTAFASRRDLGELEARRKRVTEIAPDIAELAESQRVEASRARVRTGRNDPCPCGSRKKYKHCCLV